MCLRLWTFWLFQAQIYGSALHPQTRSSVAFKMEKTTQRETVRRTREVRYYPPIKAIKMIINLDQNWKKTCIKIRLKISPKFSHHAKE